jgi:UDP-N-acetylglucosamine 2-epimerase
MKNLYKILTIVGTRPEIIKLSSTIKKIDQYFEQCLVHTGQNYDYELNEIFFKDLNLRKPDFFLDCASSNANLTIAKIFQQFDSLLQKIKPNGLILLGDTNSGLAAIVAKKRGVPIYHLEAGNRCFDFRVPEELNRKIIDHVSDINFTYTNIAKNNLLNEGITSDRIINTGSPMLEVINDQKSQIKKSKILTKLKLLKNNYFLVSFHREENVDKPENIKKFIEFLKWLSKKYNNKIIVSTHFRTQKKLLNYDKNKIKNVSFLNPFSFSDYVNLQKNSRIVFSDSGTLTEEASLLNIKGIMLRESHERPEGMEEGTVIMCGLDIKKIENAIKILFDCKIHNIVKEYKVLNFSDKIAKNILSYLNYNINKM